MTAVWREGSGRDEHRQARDATLSHFGSGLAQDDEKTLRRHLATCDACRDHYDEVMGIASLDPRTATAEERLAHGLGFRRARPARWRLVTIPALAGLAAMGLWLLLATPKNGGSDADSGFLPRGHAPSAVLPDLVTYALSGGRPPHPVEGVIEAADELAFAYRNPAGKQRLMVFAVDEHGHVYWYHPSWPDPGSNPVAVPISADPGLHELPAAVSQTYDGEHLMLHALFTDRELTVRQVEEALAQRKAAAGGSETRAPAEVFRDGVDLARTLRVRGAR